MVISRLEQAIRAALEAVVHPHTGENVLRGGQVQEMVLGEGGAVSFSFFLHAQDPGELVRTARTAVEAVDGVSSVKINLKLPQSGSGGAPVPTPGAGGAQGHLRPGSIPAPTPKPGILSEVDHVIAVSSGKGGVGKSMVSTNLAVAFAREGLRVGLLDADIYGPNIPRMFGETRRPQVSGAKGSERIEPLEAHGVRLMSLGFLLEEEQPAIMRGPLIAGILKQFLEQVAWGPLDLMIVDMPPGTGDAQLSLVQTIDLDGAVMVTTPQEVSLGDVRRGVKMFERVNTRVLGVVENMSGFFCPHCGEEMDIFGKGGGERLAREMRIPFLGAVPLDPAVRRAGDAGKPTVIEAPDSRAGAALIEIARELYRSLRSPEGSSPEGNG